MGDLHRHRRRGADGAECHAARTYDDTRDRWRDARPFPLRLSVCTVVLFGVLLVSGQALPRPGIVFWPWIVAGALAQVAATALMLAAMAERSFVVTIAYIKTEPVQVALFGLVFLGDVLSLAMVCAILVATAGVVIMSLRPGGSAGGARGTIIGLASGAAFAASAIGYRGAILSLNDNFVMAASFTLVVGLVLQASVLSVYLAVRQRTVLAAIARAWRPSLAAGFMGALASQFWFLAFALATAGKRADPCAHRSPVRAGYFPVHLQATDVEARGARHRSCRRGSGTADLGALANGVAGRRKSRPSVAVFRQTRDRMKLDALLVQRLCFVGGRLAVNRPVLDIPVVHPPGLLREFLADVVGVPHDVLTQLLQFCTHGEFLRRDNGDRRLVLGR